MSFDLLDMVKNYFTGDLIKQASTQLGENPSAISKAMIAIIPTSLAGILNKATSGAEGAKEVYESAKNFAEKDLEIDASGFGGNDNRIMDGFFGADQSEVLLNISKYSGIKESSSYPLMSMAFPPILGILGKHAAQNNLSASGLSGFLSSQKRQMMQAMPSGLTTVSTMLGLNPVGTTASSLASDEKLETLKTPIDDIHTISETPTAKWLVPLLVILAVIALLWYFSKGCNQTKTVTATTINTTVIVHDITEYNISKFESIKI
ncbi:MAG: DUF937 domain-containing protein [Ginsengibacter sp.]